MNFERVVGGISIRSWKFGLLNDWKIFGCNVGALGRLVLVVVGVYLSAAGVTELPNCLISSCSYRLLLAVSSTALVTGVPAFADGRAFMQHLISFFRLHSLCKIYFFLQLWERYFLESPVTVLEPAL